MGLLFREKIILFFLLLTAALSTTCHANIIDANQKLKEDKVNIGIGFLKNYLVAIDWEHKKLYLKQQQAPKETKTSPLFMVSYFPINNKFCVSAISTDSKWYQQGIHAGDTVIKMNDIDLSKLVIGNNVGKPERDYRK